jgi:hypothetical protein
MKATTIAGTTQYKPPPSSAAITRGDAASSLTLFAEGAPLIASVSALGVMRKLDTDLADVLEQRLALNPRDRPQPNRAMTLRFDAEVLARPAVAASRTAMLYDSQLRRAGGTERPGLGQLLDHAFNTLDPQACSEHAQS